jgi:hypothetical protein
VFSGLVLSRVSPARTAGTNTVGTSDLLPHVSNLWTLLAVLGSGFFHWLVARAQSRKLLTIKFLVNGRLSETLLRCEQLAHELTKNNIPIPPPPAPVVRNIVVRDDDARNS